MVDQKTTSDGFKANADGSAAGTFGNGLPLDKVAELRAKASAGALTADDLSLAQAAMQQATNARQWIDAATPGSASTQATNDTRAMVAAVSAALEQVQGLVGAKNTGNKPASITTVNINMGSTRASVNVASEQDRSTLISVLRQLETQAGRAT